MKGPGAIAPGPFYFRRAAPTTPPRLETNAGDFPLHEYRLRAGGREWSVLHTGAVLTPEQEWALIGDRANRLPYGVALWPSSIALAHEIAARPDDFRDRSVLELGAGTGLPGIVAATLGARVTQTDRHELALDLCRRNGERNGAGAITHRVADWTAWELLGPFDWIIGSDVLYGAVLHPHLRSILEAELRPGGRVLLADPFRAAGLPMFETLEQAGWSLNLTRWDLGEEGNPRPIGVFELTPPAAGRS